MRPDRRLEAPVLFLHLSALVLTIGPFLFFGAAVAPSLFRVLPTRDLAARVVSPVLSAACLIAEVAFGVLFATAWYLGREGFPRLTRSLFTRLPLAGFFAALVVRELLIPPIDRIRQEAPGLIDQLPAADPSRILLDRYHRLATGFTAVLIVVGVVMLILTVRLLAVPRSIRPGAARPPVPKLLDLS
jgi:hypothetical protein